MCLSTQLSRKSQEQTFLSLLGKYWRIFLFLFLFLYIFLYNIEESLRSSINYQCTFTAQRGVSLLRSPYSSRSWLACLYY